MPRELPHVVSFRTSPSEHRYLTRVRDTIGDNTWGDLFRWVLDLPEVQQAMRDQLNQHSPAGADGWGGIEASLPRGDRETQVVSNGSPNNGVRGHITGLRRSIDGVLLLEVEIEGVRLS